MRVATVAAACFPAANALMVPASSTQSCMITSSAHSAPRHRYMLLFLNFVRRVTPHEPWIMQFRGSEHRWLGVTEGGAKSMAGDLRSLSALRLRGGTEKPIDMKIFYWLENQGGEIQLLPVSHCYPAASTYATTSVFSYSSTHCHRTTTSTMLSLLYRDESCSQRLFQDSPQATHGYCSAMCVLDLCRILLGRVDDTCRHLVYDTTAAPKHEND